MRVLTSPDSEMANTYDCNSTVSGQNVPAPKGLRGPERTINVWLPDRKMPYPYPSVRFFAKHPR